MMKVQIWQDYGFGETQMTFYEVEGKDIYVYNLYTRERKKIGESSQCPEEFMLHIPHSMDTAIFQALAEALDERGIKTDKDAKIQGTLEATRFHLEDLRKMLKLK